MDCKDIFNRLWQQYTDDNPTALKIHQLLCDHGETVINDHVALRTFNHAHVNIDVIAQPFIANGYFEAACYDFPVKKLFAKHFEHKDPNMPKVFISELLTENFSTYLQDVVNKCVDSLTADTLNPDTLIFSGATWQPLDYEVYQQLLTESEYAAWLYAYGFRANHFTVNVNALKNFQDIRELNVFLKQHGFILNTSGGEIKGTPLDLLEQSSTMAEKKWVAFNHQKQQIPSCYYEFAKRYPLENGNIFQGFAAASADKTFESTDNKQ